jgi:hypothetical protein
LIADRWSYPGAESAQQAKKRQHDQWCANPARYPRPLQSIRTRRYGETKQHPKERRHQQVVRFPQQTYQGVRCENHQSHAQHAGTLPGSVESSFR